MKNWSLVVLAVVACASPAGGAWAEEATRQGGLVLKQWEW